MTDIHVFGDTGGHSLPLWRALNNIGVDIELGIIPENIQIIHLGDLIHKGPNTDSIIKVVDKLIHNNPGRWIQILGNHEFQHIEGAPYFWTCDCSDDTINTINEWWEQGLATPTYAINTPQHIALDVSNKLAQPQTSILFSHAGLTQPWWNALQQPQNALEASTQLNQLDVPLITAPGLMLGVPNAHPGPVWAVGNTEVFNSWAATQHIMPFTQIHGHTTSYVWKAGRWWDQSRNFKPFRDATKLNPTNRSVITQLNQNLLIGIDPGFSKTADIDTQPHLHIKGN